MSSTRSLASYLSNMKFEDLPPDVVEKGKLSIMNFVGNSIGGYALPLAETFLELAKDMGAGKGESTLIGDGTKVSMPLAAFGNGALSTMMDYGDVFFSESRRTAIWPGTVAVPAALAAAEARGASGKELITSAVAGYESGARLVHSMDMTEEQSQIVNGETISVFSAVAGAGRGLGLNEDEMLSAMGMAGIYTPVPGWYKWVGEDGLLPRKDIKQGWAWMCMTGAFAAYSARKGLKMLQENNILDGNRGLSAMLGMDIYKEERLTAGFGETYHIQQYSSKILPGCAVTHSPIIGIRNMVKEHGIAVDDIDGIEVITNEQDGIGFDDKNPVSLSDKEFSLPYQVAASLYAGDGGPNWYLDKTSKNPAVVSMTQRVTLSFDEECENFFRDKRLRLSKINIKTKSGKTISSRIETAGAFRTADEIRNKFLTTASQVIEKDRAEKILATLENLESVKNTSELTGLVASLPQRTR